MDKSGKLSWGELAAELEPGSAEFETIRRLFEAHDTDGDSLIDTHGRRRMMRYCTVPGVPGPRPWLWLWLLLSKTNDFIKMINSFSKTDDFIKMRNPLSKTDDIINLINSLSKTNDFIKTHKFF